MATYGYDVIVVGVGPAGCAAAYFSAKEGCRVLLVDKKDFPRDKLCGGECNSESRVIGKAEAEKELRVAEEKARV